MDFDSVVRKRKSVRSFTNKKASWKQVLEAIDAALQGPFAGNNNHLNFLIVENKDVIKKISELCEQEWIAESGILIVVCSDDANLENIYDERGRVYSRQQAGAAVQSLMLKLTDLGLGSCWVGSYPDGDIRKVFDIPKHIQIEAIVPVGYENVKSKKNLAW